MTTEADQQQQPQNGGNGDREQQPHQSPEELEVRARHRQELARIDSQREIEIARLNAESFRRMPIALRVYFDERLWNRCTEVATTLANAKGFTPPHLLGKTEACFAVLSKALTWNLDPFSVAQSTYQTPDGKIGYEGKLVQAIIEASGRLSRPIGQGEYFGDWSKVEGKFKIIEKTGQSGKPYKLPEPAWEYYSEVEEGLGVRYHIHLVGQEKPLKFEFRLRPAFPRNATTWPTRPQQQLHYAAMRALGNVVCPSLIMGVPFSEGAEPTSPEMKDVTPPTAPEPVNLGRENIRGAGRMTEEDEARQRTNGGAQDEQREEPAPAEASDGGETEPAREEAEETAADTGERAPASGLFRGV